MPILATQDRPTMPRGLSLISDVETLLPPGPEHGGSSLCTKERLRAVSVRLRCASLAVNALRSPESALLSVLRCDQADERFVTKLVVCLVCRRILAKHPPKHDGAALMKLA